MTKPKRCVSYHIQIYNRKCTFSANIFILLFFPQVLFPNLAELQLERAAEFQREKKEEKRNAVLQEKMATKERIKTAQQKSYA